MLSLCLPPTSLPTGEVGGPLDLSHVHPLLDWNP
jgi:hypothetical protein